MQKSSVQLLSQSSKMKFIILVALIAVVAADSYKPAYSAPAYAAPAYAPVYDVPNPYTFAYDVKDDHYNNMGHSESSDGKGHASGSYHVYLPDGRTQTVTYKADPYTGYVADVSYSGYAKEYTTAYAPAYKAPAYKAAY